MTPFKGTNRITSPYGPRKYTNSAGKLISEHHNGIDVVCTRYPGEPVSDDEWDFREVTGGKVVEVSTAYNYGRGTLVKVETAPGVVQIYQHNAENYVKVGQEVKQGTVLARAGATGNVTGIHLHFEVQVNGHPVDPSPWLGLPNAAGTYAGNDTLDNAATVPDDEPETNGEEVLIDVSHHQGAIDWAKVPYRALVRIGYRGYGSGKLMKDEQYDANLVGAKANNKLLGFYFFSQATTVDEAREEADFCAGLAPSGYPLFFDAEWSHETHDGRADSLTKDQRTAIAMAFCERAKTHGFTAGIYTFTAFASENIDYTYLCEDYIGWLADTRTNYDKTLPRHIHQYGQGSVPGITGVVDLNHLVKAMPAVDKPASKLQVITIGPVSRGDADAIYLLCKGRGLTDAGLYKSKWAEV